MEIEEQKQIIQYIIQENDQFKLDEFMLNDSIEKDNGAFGIITPIQLVMARTLKKGKEYHDETYDKIEQIIYDTTSAKILDYIRKNQNIYIRIFNEQPHQIFGNMKSIWIDLPNIVTKGQLESIKLLEQKYGNILKKISKKQCINDQDAMVGFKSIDGSVVLDDSFESLINYIEKYLLNENNNIIQDKNIIGTEINTIVKNQKR